MRGENQDQDLGWAPKRYPTYSAYEQGQFRAVIDGGEPVAVVWKNAGTGSGIKWIKQTDLVMQMQKMFLQGAAGDVPAYATYGAVESKFESSLGDVQAGALGGVEEYLDSLDED